MHGGKSKKVCLTRIHRYFSPLNKNVSYGISDRRPQDEV